MKKVIGFPLLFALAGLTFGIEPLGKPLLPLPAQEYQRIFSAPGSKERLPIKLLHQGLFAGQATVRARSALLLGDQGNRSSVPYLIDALSDQSMHVGANYPEAGMATTRYWANESLIKLTKQDFGFIWNDPEEKRNQSIQQWINWYQYGSKSRHIWNAT